MTLYYSSDIGASLLLFAIIYAFQVNHSHKVVFMQEVIHTAITIYWVSFILHALCSLEIDHGLKALALVYHMQSYR